MVYTMQEYTSNYRVFKELISIKRAQWTMIWLAITSVALFVGLACYGAAVINAQMSAVSRSVAAQIHNRDQLQRKIIDELRKKSEADFYHPLVVRSGNVMIHVNTFAHKATNDVSEYDYACPASAKYEAYLRDVYRLAHEPVISNVFLFAGGHGLGKTFASVQLGKALSLFADTVVVSAPMNTFGNINDAGALIEQIESSLNGDCFVVWSFDELDSYVMLNTDSLRDKTITQFAEYGGFVSNKKRVLAFTMNNPEMFLHNYWADRERIEANLTYYEHLDDFSKAVKFTGLDTATFLQEGQLSRLYSFVGNKMFLFNSFGMDAALTFVKRYLQHENVKYNNDAQAMLFGDGAADRQFSVRELKIVMDDLINKHNHQ
ncbi:hypothetical protein [Orgyia leucostigma nucleopolyhedrovirus]|uniref:Uncharacterized protein n=1 Tax=Orgyia leucostigma nucleopolyhedrovirus TaxID=490711 RepID=B0FDX9_9ABAC|nr:hypothetical protein [Orgyia leucostigma nucleopolyhedrovirus]ABY65837.1 hypothetical protein [Orgyia leucostigma nucleopolyhedrovirus]